MGRVTALGEAGVELIDLNLTGPNRFKALGNIAPISQEPDPLGRHSGGERDEMTHTITKDRNLKVLVIDGTSFVRKVVTKSLTSLGVQNIIEVADAAAAVRRLRNESFDLVVSDSQLPTMTGFELLQYIRENERIKETPFLMLTGNPSEISEALAIKSTVSDFLSKPFSTEALESKLVGLMTKGPTIRGDVESTK